ncbi:putative mediator of RNA polymerase II transcription subunit 26b [Cinnamomum micranthum f. kanehirae]|uniref:Putative mediator of RNA polymerase II transcription subunit 26b n=1 Tax=Cinnamomum micranthum f. kanehirae TaxID=337451 RepID=A0A3S3PWF4_9MAGN|nr:putative mediator of RNA polymerase II transcription subunit 26b [Cinnamomum micranthum f. kanehirae]
MDNKSGELDHWRDYFRSTNSDIFEVIEHAILVAASDCPEEFQMRRDRIAEKLYTCRLSLCSGCDRFELAVPLKQEENGINGNSGAQVGRKESKVNSSTDECRELNSQNWVSNYSYDEAEALTEELEEESQVVKEVLRIKELLSNKDETESALFESLRKLQLMGLSVEILKTTEIGRAVNALRKRGSNQIRNLARTLVSGWKDMVDEWVNTAAAIAGETPESKKPSVVDEEEEEEEGLPSPPLDEGAFFTTQPTSLELSQFFDGMDDDGNIRNSWEDMNEENGRKPVSENYDRKRKLNDTNAPKENKIQISKQVAGAKQTKPSNNNFGRERPPKFSSDHKADGDNKLPPQQSELLWVQKKPPTVQQDKSLSSDDLVQMKVEASRRNLQERYQQLENAKKQRTIQFMELHDLPKQSPPSQRNSHFKPGIHNRHWANVRRSF